MFASSILHTQARRLGALVNRVPSGKGLEIEAQSLHTIYGHFVVHGPVCVVVAAFLAWFGPDWGALPALPVWMFLFVSHQCLRTLGGLLFVQNARRGPPTSKALFRWALVSVGIHAMGALLLATLALTIYPKLQPLDQSILLLVVLIMVNHSAFTLAGRWADMAVYAPPIYLSLAWATWPMAHAYAKPLSLLVLMLLVLYVFQARNQHRVNLQGFSLAQRNGELAQELSQKNSQLQEVAAGRSRLLATVSHDLRQPAHAIGLMCERALVERHPALLQQSLVELNELSQSLSASLSTLMDLTRLDAGLVKARVRPVPLGPVLLRLESEFAEMAQSKGLKLSVVASPLWVKSDPVLLHRLLANLVSNAIKFTPSGRVDVTVFPHDGGLTVAVQDSGMGIKPDQLDLIFKEFVRGEGTPPGSEGLGLGLSIVKRYSELLDHGLSLSSQLQQGSCFSIRVPLSAAVAPAPGALPPQIELSDNRLIGLSVLVVDNVDLVLSSMVRTLSGWGCEVHAARSLSEAWSVTLGKPLDVVISDFHLGDDEPNGLMLIKHLRSLQSGRASLLPALLMTGDVSSQVESEANASLVGLMHKPVRPALLQRRVLRLLHEPPAAVGEGALFQ